MEPSDLREWVAEMRGLRVAHLRTPDGLEITLAPEPEAQPVPGPVEHEHVPMVRGPFDDPYLNVPSLPRRTG